MLDAVWVVTVGPYALGVYPRKDLAVGSVMMTWPDTPVNDKGATCYFKAPLGDGRIQEVIPSDKMGFIA